MTNRVQIVSTKILSPLHKQELMKYGVELIEADFIKTENKSFELKDLNESLIFTSQNAVHSILSHPDSEQLKKKNVYCVGSKTKTLLNDHGFNVVAHTGYAADLAEIITLIYGSESYTFFSGNMRRDTLPEALKENGIKFNEIEVYETTLQPQKLKANPEAILFFSPSGVKSYLKHNTINKQICFCIGDTTAEALTKITKNIIVADQPTIEDVIEDVIQEYK